MTEAVPPPTGGARRAPSGRPGLPGLVLSAVCGALLSSAPPPGGVPWFALALVPLFALVSVALRPRRAFWLGAVFALPFFGLYVLWLPQSFSQPSMLGPAFWVVFPLMLVVLACMWGLVTWLARLLGGRGTGTLWLLPVLWVLMEWARTQGYFGFPWGTLGYLWLDTATAQLASVVGSYGLSLLTTVAAALLAAPLVAVLRPRRPRRTTTPRVSLRPESQPARGGIALGATPAGPLIAVVLVVGAYLAGAARLPEGAAPTDRTAVLVQGNVDPFGRAITAPQELEVHTRLTSTAVSTLSEPPDLVVWPEGAVLGYSVENLRGQATRDAIQAAAPDSVILFGGRAREDGRSYNSAYAMAGAQLTGRYDKAYLVPFGERWPLMEVARPLYRAVFAMFNLPLLANTTPGKGPVPLATPEGEVATYICYESVFPQVARRMVADGATLLVNITNDAWFSRGNGARQHFDMGRMRAIETHRFLLRAGNDGITATVDPYGRVVDRLPRHMASFLVTHYALLDDRTPYVRYGGLVAPVLAALALVTAGVLALARRRG